MIYTKEISKVKLHIVKSEKIVFTAVANGRLFQNEYNLELFDFANNFPDYFEEINPKVKISKEVILTYSFPYSARKIRLFLEQKDDKLALLEIELLFLKKKSVGEWYVWMGVFYAILVNILIISIIELY